MEKEHIYPGGWQSIDTQYVTVSSSCKLLNMEISSHSCLSITTGAENWSCQSPSQPRAPQSFLVCFGQNTKNHDQSAILRNCL